MSLSALVMRSFCDATGKDTEPRVTGWTVRKCQRQYLNPNLSHRTSFIMHGPKKGSFTSPVVLKP